VVFQLLAGNLFAICKGGCIHPGLIYIIQTAYALMHPVVNKTIISPAKIISLGLDVDVVIILLPIHINHFQNIRGNLRQIILLKHTEHQYISPSAFDGLRRRLATAFGGGFRRNVLALLRRSVVVLLVRRLYFIDFNQFFSYIAKYGTFFSTQVQVYKK